MSGGMSHSAPQRRGELAGFRAGPIRSRAPRDRAAERTGGEVVVSEHNSVQRNLELQREWYGEPLGDRVRRLVVAFRISQAQLAEVLGISAPMLSQVMSGRRAKIGNPSVLARLVMLERKVLIPGVAAGESEAISQALADVRDSRPSLGRDTVPVGDSSEEVAGQVLREVAKPNELAAAAALIDGQYPALAELLRRAAEG